MMDAGKVMVAIRDMEHVDDLVKLACLIAKGSGGEIMALHVIEVPPALPLDARDEALDRPAGRIISRASKIAEETLGKRISTRVVRSRHAGEAIVDEAKSQGAQLVILGYRHRTSLGEILFGSTVQYLADSAPCRVIVNIAPARKE